MRDAPLDRMYSRHAIDPVEYQALQKPNCTGTALECRVQSGPPISTAYSQPICPPCRTWPPARRRRIIASNGARPRLPYRHGRASLSSASCAASRLLEFAGYALGATVEAPGDSRRRVAARCRAIVSPRFGDALMLITR